MGGSVLSLESWWYTSSQPFSLKQLKEINKSEQFMLIEKVIEKFKKFKEAQINKFISGHNTRAIIKSQKQKYII